MKGSFKVIGVFMSQLHPFHCPYCAYVAHIRTCKDT